MNEHHDDQNSDIHPTITAMRFRRGGRLDRLLYWYSKEDDTRADTICSLIGDIPLCFFVFFLITFYSIFFGFIFTVLYCIVCVVGLFFGLRPDKALWRVCFLPISDLDLPTISYYDFWPKLSSVNNIHLAHLPFLPILYISYGSAWFCAPILVGIIHVVIIFFWILTKFGMFHGSIIGSCKRFSLCVKNLFCRRVEWISCESTDVVTNLSVSELKKEDCEMKKIARLKVFETHLNTPDRDMFSAHRFITDLDRDKLISVSSSCVNGVTSHFVWFWDIHYDADCEEDVLNEVDPRHAD